MAERFHSLLRRQIRKIFGGAVPPADSPLRSFVDAIDRAYREFDDDRAMLERSLDISSNELVQANAELRAVFDASPDLHLWMTPAGRILNVRCGKPEDMALAQEELVGRNVTRFGNRAVAEAFALGLARLNDTASVSTFEYAMSVSGRRHAYEARMLPLPNRQVLAIIRNITELRNAEEKRFRQLAEHIQEVLWIRDPEQDRILFVSPSFEHVWGRRREELYRRAALYVDAIHPEDRARVRDAIAANPTNGYDMEFRVVRPDGSLRWVRDRAFPVKDESGIVVRITGIAADITETKLEHDAIAAANDALEQRVQERTADLQRAKDALEQSQRRYQRLFQDNNDAILVVDAEDRIVEANTMALTRFGYQLEEILRRPVAALFVPVRGRSLAADATRANVAATEVSCRRADGSTFVGEVSVAAIGIAGCADRQILVRDVSEQRAAQSALRESQEQLRQAQKLEAIGRLAGGVAHDFNNLLVVILSYADLTLASLGTDSPLAEDLSEIRRAGQRAAALTQQLLAFSRRQVLKPEPHDLNAIVSNVHRLLARLLGEDVRLELDLASELPHALVDKGQCEQIIMNLAVNARDAMPRGGTVTLATGVTSFDEAPPGADIAPGSYATLTVRDTGVGMDEATRQRVFEPFFTTKGVNKGTGLGLATVFGIVKQSRGHIDVASEVGSGSVFTVHLPFAERVGAEAQRQVELLQVPSGTERVLLVEDEEMVRRLSKRVLDRSGFDVVAVESAEEAISILEQGDGRFNLLLTDVVLPGMTGGELEGLARALHPSLRVLFMSGYTEDEMVRCGVETGERELLAKPFTPADLVSRVRGALDRRTSFPPPRLVAAGR